MQHVLHWRQTRTGIYAINSKLKYGVCSFPSTMLIFKQAKNGCFSFQDAEDLHFSSLLNRENTEAL